MISNRISNGSQNKLFPEDRPVHDWYRFVLSYPPHLVRDYLQRFDINSNKRVLDPFCGTGTTLVECKKLGIPSVGIEANPMAYLASRVKLNWLPDPDRLLDHAKKISKLALRRLNADGIDDDLPNRNGNSITLRTLSTDQMELLLTNSISPLPLHKTLVLLECLNENSDKEFNHHERLALAKALVNSISNLHFGPEVGVGPAKKDAPVISSWLECMESMVQDLRTVKSLSNIPAMVHHDDSRQMKDKVEPGTIDAVITSPPYPNEKDYTRTTRLESVLLGLIKNKADLRSLKQGLVRSNTRNVYIRDDDDLWVKTHDEIQRIAGTIEARRIELGKTSGFERLYARVTKLYFGGMARHLASLREILRPGACLAYVVGDQASYLRVMIRTGNILADIARSLGYQVIGIDLFRTRRATATREELREEVLLLHWPRTKIRQLSFIEGSEIEAANNHHKKKAKARI